LDFVAQVEDEKNNTHSIKTRVSGGDPGLLLFTNVILARFLFLLRHHMATYIFICNVFCQVMTRLPKWWLKALCVWCCSAINSHAKEGVSYFSMEFIFRCEHFRFRFTDQSESSIFFLHAPCLGWIFLLGLSVLTPAAAFGSVLIKRLEDRGIKFEIIP
jgi:hypothetical protein